MIRISSGPSKNTKPGSHFSLRILILFIFLIPLISGVTANPVSPGDRTPATPPATYSVIPATLQTSPMEWTEATAEAQFSDRLGHSTVVFDDNLWVIGGGKAPSTYFSDIWRSDNGVTWNLVTPAAPFAKRASHQSVIFNNKIWVIGGRDGNTLKPLNDVWYSSDGVNWKQATPSAEFAPRWSFGMTVFDGRMWVLGGSEDGKTHNDVWYSTNGINWTPATLHAGFSPRMEPSAVVYDGKIWVTGGFDWARVYNDVWTSDDGVTWTQVTTRAPFTARRYQNMETAGGKLWVIGGLDGKNTLNDLWYTTDGISWTLASGSNKYTPRYGFTTAVFKDRLWVIGGTSGNDVWYSEDVSSTGLLSSSAPPVNPSADLLVTKTISPSSIKTGTDTVIIITVLNKGTLPVHDIEILDTPHADFPVVDGVTQYSVQSIGPEDTTILTYTVRAAKAGSFRLNRTAVMYADQDGNYHLAYSGYADVKVLPSLLAPEPEDPLDDIFRNLMAWIKGIESIG